MYLFHLFCSAHYSRYLLKMRRIVSKFTKERNRYNFININRKKELSALPVQEGKSQKILNIQDFKSSNRFYLKFSIYSILSNFY